MHPLGPHYQAHHVPGNQVPPTYAPTLIKKRFLLFNRARPVRAMWPATPATPVHPLLALRPPCYWMPRSQLPMLLHLR